MSAVHRFTTAQAPAEFLMEIRRLLLRAFNEDFSEDDWEHTLGGWHVVVPGGGGPLSHAAVVPRILHVADRPIEVGYVEGVGTVPSRQREGLGSLVMAEASELIRSEFDMGALSTGHHNLYARLGWERWLGPTFVRRGSETVRTEEDDDGVMILRFGPSRDIDLLAPLTCEARRGDDW